MLYGCAAQFFPNSMNDFYITNLDFAFRLSHIFLADKYVFIYRKHKQDNRFIYLVTNNDEPYQNFSDHQKQTNRRVSDFEDASVILTLFPIGTNFDSGKIYKVYLIIFICLFFIILLELII